MVISTATIFFKQKKGQLFLSDVSDPNGHSHKNVIETKIEPKVTV